MSDPHTFLPYGRQSITHDDIEKMASSLCQEIITRGEKVKEFEQSLAKYVGVPYAVAFSSGSSALWAAYIAADCQSTDQVITTPNTFVATASYPLLKGSKIHFADIDPKSGNIDLEQLLLPPTKTLGKLIIAPVHFAGVAVDMKKLGQKIDRPNVCVIEDAAHALGSSYPSGETVGSCLYSDMTIFSFHPVKNITTGEGGMVTTASEELYKKLLMVRNSGIERDALQHWHQPEPWYYEVQQIACQSHMTEFQAALGLSQLEKLDLFIAQRRMLVEAYVTGLKRLPGVIAATQQEEIARSAYHLFIVHIDFQRFGTSRTKVMGALRAMNIGSQLHYVPLYRHPIFGCNLEKEKNRCPAMEQYFQEALTLPLFPNMTTKDVEYVIKSLQSILFQ
jgi:dTDP-4-amino-4,6-dideoxygalactose transaminase